MRKLYFTFTLTILSLAALAQQLPIYSQYFNNPYIYNPAFAGSQNAAYMYLNHRQQWIGIEGAPVTSSFSFNTPVARRAAMGVNIYTDKRGLLTTSSALASFGYTVPLGYNHFIRFGISAGLGHNSIDFAQVDNIQDPAVLRLLSENVFLDGQFGINYQIKNFNLGFALPKLYESSVFTDEYMGEIKLDRLKRYLFSASYKIDLGPTSSLQPMALYRMTEGLPDFIEGGMVLNLRDLIWLGGSYRMNYGATGHFGFKIRDNMSLGYAYEFATSMSSTFRGGTHEVQLGLRLGKHRDPNKKKEPKPVKEPVVKAVEEPKEEEIVVEETPVIIPEEPKVVIIEEKPIEQPRVIIEEKPVAKVVEKPVEKVVEKPVPQPASPKTENKPIELTVTKGKHPLELEKGHYVISGVFSSERNAQRYRDVIKERGYPANYGYNSENNYFYVYIHNSEEKGDSRNELMLMREKYEFKDAWLLTVENESPSSSTEKPNEDKAVKEPVKNDEAQKLNNVKEQFENKQTNIAKGPKPDDLQFSHSFQEDRVNIIVEEGEILSIQKGNAPGEMDRGHYVIAAVYKEKDKAQIYSDRLFKEGVNSKVGYNSVKNYYFIYLRKSDSEEKATLEKIKLDQKENLKDTWILEVE